MQEEITGVIERIVEEKGFGFIGVQGYDKNIFFHAKNCSGVRFEDLKKGDQVSIGYIEQTDKGNVAIDVSLID